MYLVIQSSEKGSDRLDNLSSMLKGVLEGMVLEIISHGEIYGYEIVRKLTEIGFAGMTEGTVYTILIRLEKNRMVHIEKRPSEIGPPRKFYSLNELGKKELASFWERWDFLSDKVNGLKETGGFENDN